MRAINAFADFISERFKFIADLFVSDEDALDELLRINPQASLTFQKAIDDVINDSKKREIMILNRLITLSR